MKNRFRKLGLIVKRDDPRAVTTLAAAVRHLAPHRCQLLATPEIAALCPDRVVEAGDPAEGDAVIVIGGDGTMLHAARLLAPRQVPLVGVNAGRLGFLADIRTEDLARSLDALLSGNYVEEPRALLQGEILRKGVSAWKSTALNDVVVQKRDAGRLIEFETHVDGSYVCRHRADGVIVSTPTGSTAYALSAGGPILHPGLDAIAIVPICPHTLSDRPIVVNGSARIEIHVRDTESTAAQVVLDGQDHEDLQPGDRVIIHHDGPPARLLHPAGHDYYKLLREKLHWGRDHESGMER